MKALCVMESVSRLNGGVFEAERHLQTTLARETKCEVHVLGLLDPFSGLDLPEWAPLNPVVCAVSGPTAFGYSQALKQTMLNSGCDLAYGAGLWKYSSMALVQWAHKTKRPVVVAPHGMLDSWALKHSRIKKIIAGWLYQNAQLKKAACLRAICRSEAQSIRAYGLRNQVCLIPYGVDLPDPKDANGQSPFGDPSRQDKKVLLYIGRLHRKKNIANLLTAWAALQSDPTCANQWLLAIAGWDQGGYESQLRRQVAELGIAESVLFLGPRFKDEKAACYRHCAALVLPSLSEGTPMVVLEAWSYGQPVVMTPECNLPEGFASGAAIQIETNHESIKHGLLALFAMSDADRKAMGQRGLKLVSAAFTWSRAACQLFDVYAWVLGGGPKPNSVEFF